MSIALVDYLCRGCNSILFTASNHWLRLSEKHVYLPSDNKISKKPLVSLDDEAYPGSSTLEGCTVRALRCRGCQRSLGVKVILTTPEKSKYAGKWILKRAQLLGHCDGVEVGFSIGAPSSTAVPTTPSHVATPDARGRHGSLAQHDQSHSTSSPLAKDPNLGVVLSQMLRMIARQNELATENRDVLARLDAKVETMSEQMNLLKSQMASLHDQVQSNTRSLWVSATSTRASAETVNRRGSAQRHSINSKEASTRVVSSLPNSPLLNSTTASSGDVEMVNATNNAEESDISQPRPVAVMHFASTGTHRKATHRAMKMAHMIRPSVETQEYLEQNVPQYDTADEDFEPSHMSQGSATWFEPSAQAVRSSVDRLMTPVRPLEVNKSSKLHKSPGKNILSMSTFLQNGTESEYTSQDSSYLTQTVFNFAQQHSTAEASTSRPQTVRRRGISGMAAGSRGSTRQSKIQEQKRDARGILMTPSGKIDGRSARWKRRDEVPVRAVQNKGQLHSTAHISSLVEPESGNISSNASAGVMRLNHAEVMSRINKGQRSGYAQSSLLQGDGTPTT